MFGPSWIPARPLEIYHLFLGVMGRCMLDELVKRTITAICICMIINTVYVIFLTGGGRLYRRLRGATVYA